MVFSFGKPVVHLGKGHAKAVQLKRTRDKPKLLVEGEKSRVVVRVNEAEKWLRTIRKTL